VGGSQSGFGRGAPSQAAIVTGLSCKNVLQRGNIGDHGSGVVGRNVDVKQIICEEEYGSDSLTIRMRKVCFLILTSVSHIWLVIPLVGLAIDSLSHQMTTLSVYDDRIISRPGSLTA